MSAKEMFEKLGFKLIQKHKDINYKSKNIIAYYNKSFDYIFEFWNDDHEIMGFQFPYAYENIEKIYIIDIQTLQAINKQVEELGWYE